MRDDAATGLRKIRTLAGLAWLTGFTRPRRADVFHYQVLDPGQRGPGRRFYFLLQAAPIVVVNYRQGRRSAQDLVTRADLYAAAIGTQRQASRCYLAQPPGEVGGYILCRHRRPRRAGLGRRAQLVMNLPTVM
jgi:hypothetical protein